MVKEAIEQNRRGYTVAPNELVTDFWFKYWSRSTQQYPELEMKSPGLKPANADWPEFRPSSFEKRFMIFHKLQRGYVDLQVSGASDQVDELSKLLSNYNVEVVQTGKSAAIRLTVNPINRFGSFESQYEGIMEGLISAKKLLIIGQEILKNPIPSKE